MTKLTLGGVELESKILVSSGLGERVLTKPMAVASVNLSPGSFLSSILRERVSTKPTLADSLGELRSAGSGLLGVGGA